MTDSPEPRDAAGPAGPRWLITRIGTQQVLTEIKNRGVGDVVTTLDGRRIDDGDSLVAAVRAQNPGAQVTVTVQSPGGQPRQVPVTLGTERAPAS